MLPVFRNRNFRLFWSGQAISLIGTQMQMAALSWLVLRITNSSFYLGLINAITTLPVLVFSMFAGAIADRVSKRRLLLMTQGGLLVQAFILALVVTYNKAAVWNLLLLGAMMGVFFSFDAPVRQSFVSEMVPREDVLSAVALNSSNFNAARIMGPAIAGLLLVVKRGEEICFYLNAISFVAVIIGILMMRDRELFTAEKSERSAMSQEMKEGFRYIWNERRVMGLLVMLAVTSIFGMPSFVLLPIFARDILHTGPKGLGFLFAAAGVGAFIASLSLAFVKRARRQGLLIMSCGILFGIAIFLFSFSRNHYLSMGLVALAALGLTASMAMTNSTLQILSPANMRGRVVGVYVMVFMGMMPFGSFWAGTVSHFIGAPHTVLLNGAICVAMLTVITLRFPGILKIDAPTDAETQIVVA